MNEGTDPYGFYPNPNYRPPRRKKTTDEDQYDTTQAMADARKQRQENQKSQSYSDRQSNAQSNADRNYELALERERRMREMQDARIQAMEDRQKATEAEQSYDEMTAQAEEHSRRGGQIEEGYTQLPSGKVKPYKKIKFDQEGRPVYRNDPLDEKSQDPQEAMAARRYDEQGRELYGYRTPRGETNYVDPRNYEETYGEGVPPRMQARLKPTSEGLKVKTYTGEEVPYSGDTEQTSREEVRRAAKQAAEMQAAEEKKAESKRVGGGVREQGINRATATKLRENAQTKLTELQAEQDAISKTTPGGRKIYKDEASSQRWGELGKQIQQLSENIKKFDQDIEQADARSQAIEESASTETKKKTSLKVPGE